MRPFWQGFHKQAAEDPISEWLSQGKAEDADAKKEKTKGKFDPREDSEWIIPDTGYHNWSSVG